LCGAILPEWRGGNFNGIEHFYFRLPKQVAIMAAFLPKARPSASGRGFVAAGFRHQILGERSLRLKPSVQLRTATIIDSAMLSRWQKKSFSPMPNLPPLRQSTARENSQPSRQ
jgi:hypothetical protein